MKRGVIASRLSPYIAEYIKSKGFDILSFADCKAVDSRVSHHSDLFFFFDGKNTLYVSQEMAQYKDILSQYCKNVVVTDDVLGNSYPSDVPFNSVVVGKIFICNTKTVSRCILENMRQKGYNVIDAKQGYTKCSVAVVNENAIITDDESIYDGCMENGPDCLKVSKGSVFLQGFDYGFIGGTSGKISANEIIFNGDITKHPDYKEIEKFLNKYNIKAVYSSDVLTDIGSIITLQEELK